MKIQFNAQRKSSASALILALILVLILGTTLASYLVLVRTQNTLGTQSQAWNSAMALAEAGIEEGIAQVNVAYGYTKEATNYQDSIKTNHWLALGGGTYAKSNAWSEGTYFVKVLPTTPGPTIIATGYTKVPLVGKKIARAVQITTIPAGFWGLGMAARSGITTKGNKLTVDSYDSADPTHSTNGMYNAATRKAGGDIATIGGTVDIQNANIYGHMNLGPTASYTINNGTVGSLSWAGPGIQPGWLLYDFFLNFPDVPVPYTSGWAVPVNKNSIDNTYPLSSGNYFVNGDFVMSQNETMVVSGDVTLYVTGNFNMKSQNRCMINIMPGAKMTLLVGTPNGPAVSAALTQVNVTGNPANFRYFGLPSNNSLVWVGNNTYVGAIYAPSAEFSCGGGGNNIYDYQGACVVKNVIMNGKFNFHYDEALGKSGMYMGFAVNSWKEL